MKRRSKRTKLRKGCYALLMLFVLAVLFRNSIARYAAVQIGSRVLNAQIEIEGIRIALKTVHVDGIRVGQPGSSGTLVEVSQVAIAVTPWQGIRHGVWARRVVVKEPTLHLSFDRQGRLITTFPTGGQSGSGPSKIPMGELLVRDATLLVQQTGKDDLAVKNVKLVASFADEIKLRGDIPDLWGGVIQLQAIVNAKTLEGRSRLAVRNVSIDTDQIAKLPLVPRSINDEPLTATVSIDLSGQHPAGESDWRCHGVELLASVHDVQSQKLGKVCNDFSITSTNHAGKLVVRGGGDLVDGVVGITADCDLLVSPMTAIVTLSAEQLDIGKIGSKFVPDLNVGSKLNLQANAQVEGDSRTASLTSSLRIKATEIEAKSIHLADVTCEVTTSCRLAWNDLTTFVGSVDGSAYSDGVDLGEMARRFQLPASQGRVAFSSDFHVPLADIASPEAYSMNASIKTCDVAVGELKLQDTTARLRVNHGLAIAELKSATAVDSQSSQIGSCTASARMPLAANESVIASVRLSLSPTTSLARFAGIDGGHCGGVLVADASASCVLNQLTTPGSWKALASLKTHDLAFAGETIGDIDARLNLSDGVLTVPAFPIRWRQNECRFAATGKVSQQPAVNGSIIGENIKVSDLAAFAGRFSRTPLPASGIANVEGKFHFTTQPLGLVASGSSRLSDASYAGSEIGDASLTWNADLQGVKVRSSSNQFFGGTYVLEANARELDWTRTVVEGRFKNVQAAMIAALLDKNLPISGSLDGGLSVTSIASLETLAGRAWVNSRDLNFHRIPIEITSADVSLESTEMIASCEGLIAEGRYQGIAKGNLVRLISFARTPSPNVSRVPMIVQAKLDNLPIESLTGHIQLPKDFRTLSGKLNATCIREPAMLDGSAICTASGSLSDLQLNRLRLSDRITGDVTVFGDRVELRRIEGRLADGRLSGKAEVRIASNPTGTFDFSATRVNLRRASAPFVSQPISGSGTLQLQGRIGQVMTGRADVSISHGLFAGVSIPDAKFPIDWSYSQPSKVARWQCRSAMVSAGGGKVRISSEGSIGTSLNMTTSARIQRIDSSKLMRGRSVGAGIVSGNITVQAKRARSPKQITGKYDLTLANVKTLEIPVLDQLPKLISLSPPRPGQGEDGGTVHGRIAGGLVHVDQLAISQNNIQVLMSGNATLDGRLNFDITASTQADGPADQLLDLADSPLMLAAPAPIALVARANDLLKDRVVHVHVGGIASRPSLRLQPGKQLSQDAVQFFLKNSFGSTAAEIATRPPQRTR